MKLTKELMEKAKAAESAEKLLELAKAAGIDMPADEAEKAFAELHTAGELSDEELDSVSGGWCAKPVYTDGVLSPEEVTYCFSVGDSVMVQVWGNEKRAGVIAERYPYEDYSVNPYRYYPYYRVTFSEGALLEVTTGERNLERM